MPKLGETVTEGVIGNWLQAGRATTVEFDDPLFEVSTDKVDSEIPSPYDGVIVEILVGAGETVPVGTPLVRIGAPGSAVGPSGADRLPSAAHGVAAAGGPALGDAASPSMGGSEGDGREDAGFSVPSGVGARHHDAEAGRDGHRGHDRARGSSTSATRWSSTTRSSR